MNHELCLSNLQVHTCNSLPASLPASRLVSQPFSKPVSQPFSKSVSQPASQPVSKPASQPVSQPATQSASRSASQPASRLASQPVSRPVSQPEQTHCHSINLAVIMYTEEGPQCRLLSCLPVGSKNTTHTHNPLIH